MRTARSSPWICPRSMSESKSSPVAFVTVLSDQKDAELFASRLLKTLGEDVHFQAIAGRPGFRWILHGTSPSEFRELNGQAAGFGFSFTRSKTPGNNSRAPAGRRARSELRVYAHQAQRLQGRGFGVALVRPYWTFSASTFSDLGATIDRGGGSYGLPVFPLPPIPNRPAVFESLWQRLDATPQPETSIYTSGGALCLRLSVDHVAIKTPFFETFYLAAQDGANPEHILERLENPDTLLDPARDPARQRGLAFTLQDVRHTSRTMLAHDVSTGWVPTARLSEFLDELCRRLSRFPCTCARFLGASTHLSRPGTLESRLEERAGEVAFLSHILLLRSRGYCQGRLNPRMAIALPALSPQAIAFPPSPAVRRSTGTPKDCERLDELIRKMAFGAFQELFGRSMESMIERTIIRRMTRFVPMIRDHSPGKGFAVALFGAGRHSELLLDIWRRLDGIPIQAVLMTKRPPLPTFESIPTRRAADCCDCEFDLIILSSATYEKEMVRYCTRRFPKTPLLTFWDTRMTTFPQP